MNAIKEKIYEYYNSYEWSNVGPLFLNSNFYKDNKTFFDSLSGILNEIRKDINPKYVQWLESLPRYLEGDDWLCTHAPVIFDEVTEENSSMTDFLWNRTSPSPKGVHQIYGHNSVKRFSSASDGKLIICVDNCNRGELNALDWVSKTFFAVPYKS